jgi:peptidoglycan/xylan/chitin deacetylase (PgdA/CDA1 family)
MTNSGKFVISLDFELFWGVRDKRTIENYGESILNVKQIVPELLTIFNNYKINATFATVGFLFAKNKKELIEFSPDLIPHYSDDNLSPYSDKFNLVKENHEQDGYHFAPGLIELIKKYPNQELATHTFSHYYCLEEGQNKYQFAEDIKSAIGIAAKNGIEIKSIVFPRNQYNQEYLNILKSFGINSYRGNERDWFHSYQNESETSLLKKIFRTTNCYFNISGHNCYSLIDLKKVGQPYDIPSSMFLRPYQKKLPVLRLFQVNRIKNSMTYAAKKGLLYHLWWHPHNFGTSTSQNFEMLEKILAHYKYLNGKYNFQSQTMNEVAIILDKP